MGVDIPERRLFLVPVPVPSVVFEFAVVGFEEVLQQIPRDVTVVPPSDITLPPLIAVFAVILLAAVVIASVGIADATSVVKLISDP